MKNFFKVSKVGMVFFSLLLMSGCINISEKLADTGLFGEHSLNRMESLSAITGSLEGSFFLGCGDLNGSLESYSRLQFYWSPKPNVLVVSSLPYSKLRFIIDESKDVPTIEFVFPEIWKKNASDEVITESRKLDLNYWVNTGTVVAIVKISTATIREEIYLPKLGSG